MNTFYHDGVTRAFGLVETRSAPNTFSATLLGVLWFHASRDVKFPGVGARCFSARDFISFNAHLRGVLAEFEVHFSYPVLSKVDSPEKP
jgi:hypothetical protein